MGSLCSKENATNSLAVQPKAVNYIIESESKQKEKQYSFNGSRIKSNQTNRVIIESQDLGRVVSIQDIRKLADRKQKRLTYLKLFFNERPNPEISKSLSQSCRNIKSLEKLNLFVPSKPGDRVLRRIYSDMKQIRNLNKLGLLTGGLAAKEIENLCLLLNRFRHLTTLDLYPESITNLGRLSSRLKHLRSLTTLQLTIKGTEQLNAEGITNFLLNLSHLPSLSVLHLRFYNCLKLDDRALKCLTSNLKRLRSLSNLCLVFGFPESMSRDGIESFLLNLGSLNRINSLELGIFADCFSYFNDEVMETLCCTLLKLTSLSSLKLDFYRGLALISQEGIKCFSATIPKLVSLSDLTLVFSWTDYEDKSLTELYRSIGDSPLLSNFRISVDPPHPKCDLGNKTLEDLTQAFPKFRSLSSLDIEFGYCPFLDDQGMKILSSELKELSNLSSLTLEFCCPRISHKGLEILCTSLKHLTSLTSLTLHFTSLESVGEQFSEILYANLRHLKLLSNIKLRFEESEPVSQAQEHLALRLKNLFSSFRVDCIDASIILNSK